MLSVVAEDGHVVEIDTPPEDALRLNWGDMDLLSTELWQQFEDSELEFDHGLFIGRGGLPVGNIVLRGLGFEGKDIQHLGMTSYKPISTERQNGKFQIGQKPDPNLRGGRWAIVDEVGETVLSLATARDIVVDEYEAESVVTGVLIDKPSKHDPRGLSPDHFVAETDRWVVFPMEVYDVVGKLKRERVSKAEFRRVIPKIKEIWRLPEHGALRGTESGLVVVGDAVGRLIIPDQIAA